MKRKDRLYVESDDSCAMCARKGPENLQVHHIDGDNENRQYENEIILCDDCHTRYHQGQGFTLEQVKDRKRRLIVLTLTPYGLNALKIAARNQAGMVGMPFMINHLVDLGYMEKHETQMSYGNIPDVTARFSITDKGECVLKLVEGKDG